MSAYICSMASHWRQLIIAIPFSFLMTLGLLLLMQFLVSTDFTPPKDDSPTVLPEVTWEEPPPVDERIEKIEKPSVAKNPPEVEFMALGIDTGVTVEVPEIKTGIDTAVKKINFNAAQVPIAHLLKNPRYPNSALMKGIEGWVEVMFDVSPRGVAENIRIVAAYPEGVFEKAVIRAAKQWRFQVPVNENGQPKPFRGLVKRMVFELGSEQKSSAWM